MVICNAPDAAQHERFLNGAWPLKPGRRITFDRYPLEAILKQKCIDSGQIYWQNDYVIFRIAGDLIKESQKSVLLLGPRQVGKSTLLKRLRPDLTINLSLESEYYRHSSNPDLLISLIRGTGPKTLFIDEIQRIPSMLNTIQAILDDWENPPRFYLSGSSARKLKRGQANLLPGRIFIYYLGGLSPAELNYSLDTVKALRVGLLPGPYLQSEMKFAEKSLRDYAAIYLTEEIQAEALTRNVQGFARFLQIMATVSGTIIDTSKIARRSGVARSSVNRFIEILEDTLIAQRVWSFKDSEADVITHPKIYFFDPGVLNALLGNFEPSADRSGVLFEHLVYSLIRNSASGRDVPCEFFFFRTRNGVEVDFVIRLRGELYAIEVKSGHVTEQDIRGLVAFRNYYPHASKYILVTLREERRVINGILICGVNQLMQELEL